MDLVEKQISPHNTNANEILGSNWIYIIDSGGQPHFHNLLPHFVHGISVALFVHRLSSKLEEYPIVEYFERNQAIGEAYRSSLTTEDTLKCLVRSMQSHTIDDEKPKLVFIGTFLDKIGQSSETLVEKNEKLLKLLTPEFAEQLIFCQRGLIFPLNAKSPSAHEGGMAELIRSVVESAPSIKVTIPIWWYVLEITLKKLSVHFDRMVLSRFRGSLVPRLFFFLLCLLEHEKQVAETRREREYLHACLRKRKAWCLIIADTAIN